MGVLFRVDAGRAHGLGHLQRCLALASALRRDGAACLFMVPDEAGVVPRIEAAGCSAVPPAADPGTPGDAAEVIAAADRHGCGTIVVDSYAASAEYLRGFRVSGRFVVAIDDLAASTFPCQVVINGAAHAPRLRYRASLPDTVFLLGPRYALLRPEFWTSHTRSDGEDPPRVMLAVGGSDPFDVVPGLIETVAPLREEFAVDVIVGPFFHNLDHVERAANQAGRPVELHVAPTSVRPIMERATLAVSAAGQTLYELACVGCPTVAIQMAPNQRPQLNALEAAGVLYSIGGAARPDTLTRLAEAIPALLADRPRRAAMSAAGRRLVDGEGALRVAAAITSGFSQTMTGAGSSAREH